MAAPIRGLLLCGGRATRFGSDKLLALVGGEPLAARSARNLAAGAGNALAVIDPGAQRLRALLEGAGCEIVASERCARGLGASLAAGVAATREAAGWIVALGDMPFVRAETIAAVRAALESGAAIAAPVLAGGERGHPVGFSSAFRDELAALDGDEGARSLLARHRGQVVSVTVDDPGILVDIDTEAQLRGAERR